MNTLWLTALLSYSFSKYTVDLHTNTSQNQTAPHKCTTNNNKNTDDDDHVNDSNERQVTVDARSDSDKREKIEKKHCMVFIIGMH